MVKGYIKLCTVYFNFIIKISFLQNCLTLKDLVFVTKTFITLSTYFDKNIDLYLSHL